MHLYKGKLDLDHLEVRFQPLIYMPWHFAKLLFYRITNFGPFSFTQPDVYCDTLHYYRLHQDRHPKSLVRLRICPSGPLSCGAMVTGRKKRTTKKNEHWAGFELGSSDSQTVSQVHGSTKPQDWLHTNTHTYMYILVEGQTRWWRFLRGVNAKFVNSLQPIRKTAKRSSYLS